MINKSLLIKYLVKEKEKCKHGEIAHSVRKEHYNAHYYESIKSFLIDFMAMVQRGEFDEIDPCPAEIPEAKNYLSKQQAEMLNYMISELSELAALHGRKITKFNFLRDEK